MAGSDDLALEVPDDIVQDLTDLLEMRKVEEISHNQLQETKAMRDDPAAAEDPDTASSQHLPCHESRQSPQKNLPQSVNGAAREQDHLPHRDRIITNDS